MISSCILMKSTGNLNRSQAHKDMIESVHSTVVYLVIISLDYKVLSCK